ncbi:MAG: alpha-L-fucosidase [Mangrovibacterium sp.]
MKNIFNLALVFAVIVSSCQQPTGNVMEVSNTIEVADGSAVILSAAHVVPSERQYQTLQDEFIAFVHYGPNSFTQKEWGNGMESPEIFNPSGIDTDQWCEAMKAAGMTKVILTAKHHDGYVLWQSRYTKHGIMSSPYADGKADIMKDLSASCQKYGLKLGVYLSPADLYHIENPEGLYGNLSKYTERTIPRQVEGRPFANKTTFTANVDDYNEYFMNQLFELLTEYGPIHEVWFDGAHPKRKGNQQYNYLAWKELIRALAPDAVIFGKEDIRWCGNEGGFTRDTEWNVMPYQEDPDQMGNFPDLMKKELGEPAQLADAKYLHYQPAETNTSIREGWFYRDEQQKVRSVDDVFDMYERTVGGNSIFLLNIPPNREGLFPQEDVRVLQEVGRRINATYGENLFAGAKGVKKVLDENPLSSQLLDEANNVIEITTKEPVTVNRFVIQEDVKNYGERVVEHVFEVFVDGEWKEIVRGTNIGYKRILRFQSVTGTKFRFRVLAQRYNPAIATISAHFCETTPPQLELRVDAAGMVSLLPKQQDFKWHASVKDFADDVEVRYTTDGTEPNEKSQVYAGAFAAESKVIRAKAFVGDKMGAELQEKVGLTKKNWKLLQASSAKEKRAAQLAFDGDAGSFWQTENTGSKHSLAIDLGATKIISGFAYTPQTRAHGLGMIQSGYVEASANGKTWRKIESFEFSNLINMPTTRQHFFAKSVELRYIRFTSTIIAGGSKEAAVAEIDLFE